MRINMAARTQESGMLIFIEWSRGRKAWSLVVEELFPSVLQSNPSSRSRLRLCDLLVRAFALLQMTVFNPDAVKHVIL